jgi:hypothetical protein
MTGPGAPATTSRTAGPSTSTKASSTDLPGSRVRSAATSWRATTTPAGSRVPCAATMTVTAANPSPAVPGFQGQPVTSLDHGLHQPWFAQGSAQASHRGLHRVLVVTGRRDVSVTAALGPHPLLVRAVGDRLRAAGWRCGDAVVLAAAGSSDPRAVADVRAAAAQLSGEVGARVRVGFVATGAPRVAPLVAGLRAAGKSRVAVASWLLAPGLFHRRLSSSGADVVAAPLGAHPAVIDRLVQLTGADAVLRSA